MKKILFFTAALAVMLTSCQKEKGSDDSSAKGVKTITASIGNSTKVAMGIDDGTNTKLNWEIGDNLFLMDKDGSTGKYSSLNAGETATFNLIDGDGVSPEGLHVAAYPYDGITIDTSDGYPTILFKYSDSQTYTENSFDKNAMPLLAMNETGTNFSFNAMAPVLRLNVKLATAISDVKVNSVVIESANRNLSGFSNWDGSCFYEPGESYGEVGSSITLNCGEGVPISTTATQFCMVIPANEDDVDSDIYPSGDLTITVRTNKGNIVKTSKAAATFVAGKVYNINVSGDPTPALPAGALPGKFTVDSEGTKVYFSKGNLQATYNGLTYTWDFAANQYDYIGNDAGNTSIDSQESDKVVDLFGWSTNEKYGINISTQQDHYLGVFKDWGENIGDGKTWRTLTNDEWVYLFNTRSASTVNGVENARYAKATVNSEYGVILLPDSYTHPAGVVALTNINKADASFDVNSYYISAWTKLESAGAVFLPAAGGRSGSKVEYFGTSGFYWSSTVSTDIVAYDVDFYSGYVTLNHTDIRSYGCSVRLVTDAN